MHIAFDREFPTGLPPKTLRRLLRRGLIGMFVKQWLAVPAYVADAQHLEPGSTSDPITHTTVAKIKP